MSTRFSGVGNIGSDPEVKVFSGEENQPPVALLRFNVRFDNPVPSNGELVDRGGFWANVVRWHPDVETAEKWIRLYQRGMRVMVDGRMEYREWEKDGEPRDAFQVRASHIGILPHRLVKVEMEERSPASGQQTLGELPQEDDEIPESSTDQAADHSFDEESSP
ncbi:hypothetical protein L861_06420 [Litchfieldella anticariensis FP35 = DSM 16096]|uniref:Single-stranded DNA-binding protein n=1 Tax=Litchfieldella anticariensis (strain DSM 16096 / CECT 5854 / CIP 108499 / LMG 22089 / FP35) TaxID=1121939 RepID=S2KJK4_LITA3|nr:single-stranded DNA-binding protein [Halomonas anticariensis]EPC00568.1 hypothetical protein L861_06420 [Halomonas anticariensis FP35 = DSM 16096]